jgi:hypothetical protein
MMQKIYKLTLSEDEAIESELSEKARITESS